MGLDKATEKSQAAIIELQRDLQQELRSGAITLQNWDAQKALLTGGAVSVLGFFTIAGEDFELSESAFDALDIARISTYTGKDGALGWAGWIGDLANPIEDVRFLCETGDEMFRPVEAWVFEFWDNYREVKRANIHTGRNGGGFNDVPGVRGIGERGPVTDPHGKTDKQRDKDGPKTWRDILLGR